MNIGVILSAGIGARFNSDIPKQYMKLNGREIVFYTIDSFKNAKNLDHFIVMVDSNEFNAKNIASKYQVETVCGGSSRNQTINNAIEYIQNNYPSCQNILFHDAARPFINSKIIDEYLDILKDYHAIVTCAKITDSIGSINDNEYIDRENYCLIQAPEGYRFSILSKYSNPDSVATVPLQQIKEDIKIYRYFNQKINMKITFPEDLFLAEQLIKLRYVHKDNLVFANQEHKLNILLFGASGGVGSCLKDILTKEGHQLFCPNHLEIDLSKVTVNDLKNYLKDKSIDAIINCAATYVTDDDGLSNNFELIFNVNFKSNLVLIEYAKTINKKIKIILMSSSSATRGRENLTLYSASKAALNSMIESLANNLKEQNIFINGIIPEKINTPLIAKLHKKEINTRELLDVSDIINAVLYFLNSNHYGELLHIRKGMN